MLSAPARARHGGGPRLWFGAALTAGLTVLALAGLPGAILHAWAQTTVTKPAARYVGEAACVQCHEKEHQAWLGSHHQLAMQPANEKTVLGNFNHARFSYAGTTSTFFKRDGKFFVRTDGADGKLADFEIKYTFGVSPLQQYLIEFPDGRVQALSIVWDARPKAKGGQRWYHLYPKDKITHADPLHWTKLQQNWNFMCAECHSTNLRKNYDATTNTFKTDWTDINVSCEACHGPGSAHLTWAEKNKGGGASADNGLLVHLDERAGVKWIKDAANGNLARSEPRTSAREIETCSTCHARRAQMWEGHVAGQPLVDTHLPALLTQGLYEADGQMRDEVYNYGSFLQSKMFAQGVTCGDCHDPHSGKTRAPGNAVCLQCHMADKYEAVSHHRHAADGPAASCPACHMPVRTYMGIHARHDHSFRVPRPDLSVVLGTPNACNDCHTKKSAQWAASAVEKWYGPDRKGFQNFAPALKAARAGQPAAKNLLMQVAAEPSQPAIARATAYAEMAAYLTPSLVSEVQRGLYDKDPLVRLGALQGLAGVPVEQRWGLASHLLRDPVRTVRVEAVSFLAAVPPDRLSAEQRADLDKGIAEYEAAQQNNADRPEAHHNLGLLYAQRGDLARSEAQYKSALKLDPSFSQVYVNLADLYRAQGKEDQAQAVLHDALRAAPGNASVHYALGLSLVRLKRYDEALPELAKAAKLDPTMARYAYVYAIGLDSTGKRKEALRVLEDNSRRHPADRDTLLALAQINQAAGQRDAALTYARKLQALLPNEPSVAQLVKQLTENRER
jgi:predicted CXXCH cytochrome family protein